MQEWNLQNSSKNNVFDAVYWTKTNLISMFRFEKWCIFIFTWLPINKQSLISTVRLLLIGYYRLLAVDYGEQWLKGKWEELNNTHLIIAN